MARYAALIRGIMPSNPNMRNEKLRAVFEVLGLTNVRTVIASGNVLFESGAGSAAALEKKIEKALSTKLGIKGVTIIRSKAELDKIIAKDPFKGAAHSRENYLIVTFAKKKPREIFNALDATGPSTTDFMKKLEKEHGADITTRTWKTVERLAAKLAE